MGWWPQVHIWRPHASHKLQSQVPNCSRHASALIKYIINNPQTHWLMITSSRFLLNFLQVCQSISASGCRFSSDLLHKALFLVPAAPHGYAPLLAKYSLQSDCCIFAYLLSMVSAQLAQRHFYPRLIPQSNEYSHAQHQGGRNAYSVQEAIPRMRAEGKQNCEQLTDSFTLSLHSVSAIRCQIISKPVMNKT